MAYLNNKKRILSSKHLSLAICSLLLLTSFAITSVTSIEPEDLITESESYTFTFIEPSFQALTADESEYTNIQLSGCLGISKKAGDPLLPVKFIKLLLPAMKTVSNINVIGTPIEIDLGSTDLKSSPIIPYQNPVHFGASHGEFIINSKIYSSDNVYPSKIYDDYRIGYCRGYPILDIALKPVQYNPVQGKIYLYPEITIHVEYEDVNEVNQFYRNNQNDKEWVKTLVYNPKETESYPQNIPIFGYEGGLCDPKDDFDYVIITTEENSLDYWDTTQQTPYNWESLMQKHKDDDGLSCTLVTIADIYDCNDYSNNPPFNDPPAYIREFCKDAYLDWNTTYILIGGDDDGYGFDGIPARHMDTTYEGEIDADIYWSNLDNNFNDDEDGDWGEEGDEGFDLYAEIFIGRVTCDEPQDVSNWLTKCFFYADSGDPDYLENAAFYGGNTGWQSEGDDFMDFSAVKGTDDWLGPDPHHDGPWPTWLGFLFGFETWNQFNPGVQYNMSVMWTAEPPNPGWKGGSESQAVNGLKDAINNDHVAFISGIAHANADMSLDVGKTSWERDYTNTKPFFIHDYGCHCGDIDASDDGVLHSMLFHSDTELAFGCVYNTCYGWGNLYCTNSSSALQTKLFWDYFLDVANNSGDSENWQFGKAHAWSKDVMAPTINWDPQYGTWRAILQGCLLFGDPAQRFKTINKIPDPPKEPSGPTEGETNIEYSFSSSTTDPEGEQIYYMFDWGDGTTSEWIGPFESGETGEATHAWTKKGHFEVKVKAKDIKGGVGKWSDPLSIHILQEATMNIELIRGGLLKVNAGIKNVGEVESTPVQWTINLEGGTIIMGKESSGEIPSITPGESVTIKSGNIIGFGKTTVTITAEIPEGIDTRVQHGNMLLFFIYVNPGETL
jgi:hypothetical protein